MKNKKRSVIIFIISTIFILISASCAGSPGVKATEDAAIQAQEGLELVIAPSIDYAFNDKWYRTLGETLPYVPVAKKVEKGQIFFIRLFASGYSIDKENNMDLAYDISILTPSGEIYAEYSDLKFLKQKSYNNYIQAPETIVHVSFDPQDEYGTYLIKVTLKDNVSGGTAYAESTVELVEDNRDKDFENDQEFYDWAGGYHETKKISGFMPALYYYAKTGKYAEGKTVLFAFFLGIVYDNEFLPGKLIKEFYSTDDYDVKHLILNLLLYVRDREDVQKLLDDAISKDPELIYDVAAMVKENAYIFEGWDTISTPHEIEALKGFLFSMARYDHLKLLLHLMTVVKEEGNQDLYDYAYSSFRDFYNNITLFKNYADFMYANDNELTEQERLMLGQIIGESQNNT